MAPTTTNTTHKKRKRNIDHSEENASRKPPQKKCKISRVAKPLFERTNDQRLFMEIRKALEESELITNLNIPKCISKTIAFDSMIDSTRKFSCYNDDCKNIVGFTPWEYYDKRIDAKYKQFICRVDSKRQDQYYCEECTPMTQRCSRCHYWRMIKTVSCSVCTRDIEPCSKCSKMGNNRRKTRLRRCIECRNPLCNKCGKKCFECHHHPICPECFDRKKTGKFKFECTNCGNFITLTHANCEEINIDFTFSEDNLDINFALCFVDSCREIICTAWNCNANDPVTGHCRKCNHRGDPWARYYCKKHAGYGKAWSEGKALCKDCLSGGQKKL